MVKRFILSIIAIVFIQTLQAQYISEVLEYKPAPGQFINSSPWGMPDDHNSNVSIVGRLNGAMSLGAFGGYVIFKFANPVENHKDNPYGVDFVIYGNPLKNLLTPQNPNNVTWSEPGIVSVMEDTNKNGLPDDTWYELAGSDYFFSTTIKNYSVTYYNPKSASAADVNWEDNQGNTGKVKANSFHKQPYYPKGDIFDNVNQESYTLSGTRIKNYVDKSNPSFVTFFGRPWGYVDNTLRGQYNGLPDNPYTDNIEENSGGDAFDIDWAVDENGNYVDLDKIDFIKVHNAVLADAGWLGEVSTEITGAFDVAPNSSITGIVDRIIIKELPDTIVGDKYQIEAFAFKKGRWNKDATLNWEIDNEAVQINQENMMTFSSSRKVNLKVSLDSNPDVFEEISTVLEYEKDTLSSIAQNRLSTLKLYPNPASEKIYIEGANNTNIKIYNLTGNVLLTKENYKNKAPISIANLNSGIYFIKICQQNKCKTLSFVKN